MVAMGIEFSGESPYAGIGFSCERPCEDISSVENAPISQRINSLAHEIVTQADKYDSAIRVHITPENHIFSSDAGAEDPPIFSIAQKLAESVQSAQRPAAGIGISAEQAREAGEAARKLRQRLGRERKHTPESARLARILARAQELELLLVQMETEPSRLAGSEAGTRDLTMFEVVEQLDEGDRVIARVRPRPHPATLEVAAPSHGQVRVSGLARFFPAHTIHARRSTAVVTADDCELRSVDHYHVHRVSVSLEPLLTPDTPGHSALQHLLKDPTDSAIAEFQRSMQRIADPPEQHQVHASVPVQFNRFTSVTSSEVVQQGPGSRTKLATHYLVEESELPIIDFLARDRGLVRSLVAAVADETRRGSATRVFLRDTLRCAGHADDLALLEHSAGLHEPDTLLLGFFGVDIVDQASVVMVGSGNRLRQDMKVDRGKVRADTVLNDIDRIHKQAAQARIDRSDEPAPARTRPASPSPPLAPRHALSALIAGNRLHRRSSGMPPREDLGPLD
jgi:hypothetical protein